MKVVKRNGDLEDYNPEKVVKSLKNSGVSESTINKILQTIKDKRFDSISTDKLYKIVYQLVKKLENKYNASIYSLKQAIMRLGPDGYTFEDYIAKIFAGEGFKVKTRQVYESNCITHELDVVGDDFFVECKYHNSGGITSGIKDVMYSHARFLDLKDACKNKGYHFRKLWVATNTKFSDECIDYGKYWGLKLMSWKYDGKNSLSYIIDTKHYFPVTLLPSVGREVFSLLSRKNILLITEVRDKSDEELKSIGLSADEVAKLRTDCDNIIEAAKKIEKINGGKK